MIKVLRFLNLGKNISRVSSLRGGGAIFLWAIMYRTNHPKGNSPWGKFSGGILSEGNYLWGNCTEAIIGGNRLGGNFSGWQFSTGAIILGGKCPRGNFPRRKLFEHLVFVIRFIWILSNIWLMFICLKRFFAAPQGGFKKCIIGTSGTLFYL